MRRYLQPTAIIDSEHEAVVEFTKAHAGDVVDPREKAIRLYYAVRDTIRYDPYSIDLSVDGLSASTTLRNGRGWCVPKAILFTSCCRAAGIPARIGFADVRNHLSTERMRKIMKTDLFCWHGYVSMLLDGNWIKATPAFNIELTERFRLRALDFDGHSDALYHPFDCAGNRHMEYVHERGEFVDVPLAEITETFARQYSALLDSNGADFERDVERETAVSA